MDTDQKTKKTKVSEHSHAHGHCHGHHHHPLGQSGSRGRIQLAFWANFLFALVELVGGVIVQSFAVTSNAVHDLGDSLALAMSLVLEKKSLQKSDSHFSYGYRRYSIASAFLTSVFLVSGSVLVIFFGVQKILQPMAEFSLEKNQEMMGLAVLGVVVNAISMWTLNKGSSLNEKALSWHFVQDIASWILVLVSGFLIAKTGWVWLDVALGILLSVWILWNVQKNLRELLNIFLQATPKNISTQKINQALSSLDYVENVHHMHIWTLDGEMHVLTAHISLRQDFEITQISRFKQEIKNLLKKNFDISEATLEFESHAEACADPVHL